MKNRISKLIPLAFIIAFACAMVPNVAPATTSTIEAMHGHELRLTYAIADAPAAIKATAEALGIEPIGYLPPKLYTSWTDGRKHFDAEKAQRNLPAITAILENNEWGITDLEKNPRRIVRFAHEVDDDGTPRYLTSEIRWAIEQYETMWKWFRWHFPELKLSEWNLSPSRDSSQHPLAEGMMLRHLDAIDISMFWNTRPGWFNGRRKILRHAVELGRQHDKPVIVWIWERYKVWNEDRTVAVYEPLSREAIDQMLDLAISEGVDIVVLWSNTYSLLAADNPAKVIAETIGRDPDYDPLPAVNARIVSLMAEMRLRAEALNDA